MRITVITGSGIDSSGSSYYSDSASIQSANPSPTESLNQLIYSSLSGWLLRPGKMLDRYNRKRSELVYAQPGVAHNTLTRLSRHHKVSIITLNVDDLHERAGSREVLHLHGNLLQARCENKTDPCIKQLDYLTPMRLSDLCVHGLPYRPDLVWLDEEIMLYPQARNTIQQSEIVLVAGTPVEMPHIKALLETLREKIPIHHIDPSAKNAGSQFTPFRLDPCAGLKAWVSEFLENGHPPEKLTG